MLTRPCAATGGWVAVAADCCRAVGGTSGAAVALVTDVPAVVGGGAADVAAAAPLRPAGAEADDAAGTPANAPFGAAAGAPSRATGGRRTASVLSGGPGRADAPDGVRADDTDTDTGAPAPLGRAATTVLRGTSAVSAGWPYRSTTRR